MSTSTRSSQVPRRSTRISGRTTVVSEVHLETDMIGVVDSKDLGQPRKKRQKKLAVTVHPAVEKSLTSRKPRRGKLRDLPEMPLDILFDIFAHLLPLDVLRLSRTSKAIRNVLMRRSAVCIWRSAFNNRSRLPFPPPPRPEDVNEVQWASLLFDAHCFLCLDPAGKNVLWVFRLRCCKRCLNHGRGKFTTHPDLTITPSVPYSSIIDALPSADVVDDHDISQVYQKSDAKDLIRELKHSTNQVELLEEKKRVVRDLRTHAESCRVWCQLLSIKRVEDAHDTRERRKKAIISRLENLGWKEEISLLSRNRVYGHLHPLLSHPLVRQPKDLTDRIWANVRPVLVKFLEDLKAGRLEEERQKLVRGRVYALKVKVKEWQHKYRPIIIPPIADICDLMEGVKETLEKKSDTYYFNIWGPVEEALPRFAEDWRKAKGLELLALLPRTKGRAKPDLSRLDLAITSFRCNSCGRSIRFPRILAHACLVRKRGDYREDEQSIKARRSSDLGVVFDDIVCQIMRSVLQQCDLNPDTTTMTDIADRWVECVGCFKNTIRKVMPFTSVVEHCRLEHVGASKDQQSGIKLACQWSLLCDDDKALAQQQVTVESSYCSRQSFDVHCIHCGKLTDTSWILYHLRNEHGFEITPMHKALDLKPEDSEYYYMPIDHDTHEEAREAYIIASPVSQTNSV